MISFFIQGIIGTPGGDSGEFIIALAIYAKNGGNVSSDERILEIFQTFMGTVSLSRQFYMHTDSHALEQLEAQLFNLTGSNQTDIFDVPLQYQDAVFQMVIQPTNIGCGHLRLITLHPEEYRVNYSLSTGFIKAYFNYLWNHESWVKLSGLDEDYEVLQGLHTEGAVVNVIANHPTSGTCMRLVPTVVPSTQSSSFFVNHPKEVSILREQLATFFVNTYPQGLTIEEFKRQIDELAAIQLNATLTYLASGKPIYQVTFTVTETSKVVDEDSPGAEEGSSAWVPLVIVLFLLGFIVGGTYLIYNVHVYGCTKEAMLGGPSKRSEKYELKELAQPETKSNSLNNGMVPLEEV